MVYSQNNFSPNDIQYAWDGKSSGSLVNPGVFAYRLIVEINGRQEMRYGDVTLVR